MTTKKTPATKTESIRLNRFLAMCGVCSRRKADEYIEDGLVRVNGSTVFEMGLKINPKEDQVFFRKQRLKLIEDHTYIVIYKPRSVLTTLTDPLDRPTIMDIVPKKYKKQKLFPVGRLDWNS